MGEGTGRRVMGVRVRACTRTHVHDTRRVSTAREVARLLGAKAAASTVEEGEVMEECLDEKGVVVAGVRRMPEMSSRLTRRGWFCRRTICTTDTDTIQVLATAIAQVASLLVEEEEEEMEDQEKEAIWRGGASH